MEKETKKTEVKAVAEVKEVKEDTTLCNTELYRSWWMLEQDKTSALQRKIDRLERIIDKLLAI